MRAAPGHLWQCLGPCRRTWAAPAVLGVPGGIPTVPDRVTACWAGLVVGTAFTRTQVLEETFHTCLFAMYDMEIQVSFSAWHIFTQLKAKHPKHFYLESVFCTGQKQVWMDLKQTCLKLFEVICSFSLKDGTAAFQCQNFSTG